MPIPSPSTPLDVINIFSDNLRRVLPDSRPQDRGTMLYALSIGTGYSVYDLYRAFNYTVDQSFPQTSDFEYLQRDGASKGVFQLPATGSSGIILETGLVGTLIPEDTVYTSDDTTYITTGDVTISDISISCVIVTSSGIANVTTSEDHHLNDLIPVLMSGASTGDLNGEKDISVFSATSFTYPTSAPNGTDGGTPFVDFTAAVLNVITDVSVQDNVGTKTNATFDDVLSIETPIDDVDGSAVVDIDGLTGGTDIEDVEPYRERVIFRWQNPLGLFNAAAITIQCQLIQGVTRVFVYNITPLVGQVTVFFVRDGDDDIVPTPTQITETRDKLLEILPATTDENDVIFPDLIAVPVDFDFSELLPATATMQDAVTQSLIDFFSGSTDVGVDVDEDLYRASISNSISVNGETIQSFTLTTPTGDVTIATDEIGVIGDITYS